MKLTLEKYKQIYCAEEKNGLNAYASADKNSIPPYLFPYDSLETSKNKLRFLNSNFVNYVTVPVSLNRYFYIIEVKNPNFFIYLHQSPGFSDISQSVLEDIKSNKAKLIINFVDEAVCRYENVDDWISEVDIPHKNVYIITGNLTPPAEKYKFNIISITLWDNIVISVNETTTFNPTDKSLFLCLNGAFRGHRLLFLSLLHKHRILELGLSSYFNLQEYGSANPPEKILKIIDILGKAFDPDLFESINHLRNKSSSILDNRFHLNLHNNFPFELYNKTFVSVVTETMSNNEMVFLTEKIWTPIIAGHPFMVVSSAGYLKKLKELGFKTYDKWFDESYDSLSSLYDRCEVVIKNLKKYSELNNEELKSIRQEMESVANYNKEHLKQLLKQKYIIDGKYYHAKPIADKLLEILETWN